MTRKQRKNVVRIVLSVIVTAALAFVPATGAVKLLLYLVPYFIIGYDILQKAGKRILSGQVFDENFLMAAATVGAIVIGAINGGDYIEAIAVMVFYQLGELFESIAVGKSRKSISELMDIRPDYANIERDGEIVRVDPDEIEIGTEIIVCPGEKIPIDGTVTEGSSSIDTAALTGESVPRDVTEGSAVLSGCINMTGVLRIKTEKAFGDSAATKILDLIENASSNKSKSEEFISKFARLYTPIVCYSALAVALLPPFVSHMVNGDANWSVWIYRALSFLVASCPCALVISIPLAFFAGIGRASKVGVLIKGSNYLEALGKADCIVFDKTGTLTEGTFEVAAVHHNIVEEQRLIEYAAHAEYASSHPISKSLVEAYEKNPDRERIGDVKELSGKGVIAEVDGKTVACGNARLMEELGIEYRTCHRVGTVIHIAIDNEYAGHIVIADKVKATSGAAIAELKKIGIRETVVLSGDIKNIVERTAVELGIDKVFSELLPGDKVKIVEDLIAERDEKKTLAFVGDGINDAPALARADIGIAMGAAGSDAAIEAADVVLMDDDPMKLVSAIGLSKKCMRIVNQNIVLALGIKLLALVLVAIGAANMWLAIFADVGVMVLAVLNSVRMMLR